MNTMKLIAIRKHCIWAGALFGLIFLSGCASGPKANPNDLLEPMNRAVFSFNEGVDTVVLKPIATGYRAITPSPVRQGVSNVFGNLRDIWSAANLALQGRGQQFGDQIGRVMINSLVGLGGVFDVASEAGIERTSQDFGQTLGRWGVGEGAFVVLPLLGPSTVRDTVALPVDSLGDPMGGIDHVKTRNAITGLRIVDTRANLLRAGEIVDDVALDKYSFIRDAYLQRRRASIGVEASDKQDPDSDGQMPPPIRPRHRH